jgi:hypothetical protein
VPTRFRGAGYTDATMTTDGTREHEDAPVRQPPVETPAPTAAAPPRDARWWGETALPVGGVARVVAGPLRLWARRRAHEWALVTTTGSNGHAGEAERGHPVPEDDVPESGSVHRFSFAQSPAALVLRPVLADRAVVVRPESPLWIPSGERVVLFMSTPVWVGVSVGRPSRQRVARRRGRRPERSAEDAVEDVGLIDIPTYRLSDTWFGPSTLVGELCYSSRTAGRLALDELPTRPHRAVTPVTIENLAASSLELRRLVVPIPSLALYADTRSGLWTQGVTLSRETDSDLATARVDTTPPTVAHGPPERLADARLATPAGGMVHAFSRLFRGNGEP